VDEYVVDVDVDDVVPRSFGGVQRDLDRVGNGAIEVGTYLRLDEVVGAGATVGLVARAPERRGVLVVVEEDLQAGG
jgi:hypothetical protein